MTARAPAVWFLGPERAVNNWRTTWPAAALREAGHDAHAISPDGETDADIRPGDVVVIHHSNQIGAFAEGYRALAPFIEVIRREAAPRLVVVQWDDSYPDSGDIQDTRDAAGDLLPGFAALLMDVAECCRSADRVIATTPYLAGVLESYGAADVRVVPNYIARWVTELELPPDLGSSAVWLGTLGGIPEPGRRRSAHLHDWSWAMSYTYKDAWPSNPNIPPNFPPVKVVGIREYREHRWFAGRLGPGYSYARATFDLERLYREVATGTCLGLAPVADIGFNKAKSWIKPLEYAALGMHSVVAPTDEYRRLDIPAAVHRVSADKFWPAVEFYVSEHRGDHRHDWLRAHVANHWTVERHVGEWEEALDL